MSTGCAAASVGNKNAAILLTSIDGNCITPTKQILPFLHYVTLIGNTKYKHAGQFGDAKILFGVRATPPMAPQVAAAAPVTKPYYKSGSGFCITVIQRLDESRR